MALSSAFFASQGMWRQAVEAGKNWALPPWPSRPERSRVAIAIGFNRWNTSPHTRRALVVATEPEAAIRFHSKSPCHA